MKLSCSISVLRHSVFCVSRITETKLLDTMQYHIMHDTYHNILLLYRYVLQNTMLHRYNKISTEICENILLIIIVYISNSWNISPMKKEQLQ